MESEVGWVERAVRKHDDDLYHGNGKPGITTRIQVCEEKLEDHDILLNGGNGEVGMVREWRDF